MMSLRGSRPKIASANCTEPLSLPSRVVTFSSMSRPFLLDRSFRRSLAGDAELAGLRRFLRQRLLHRIAHHDPAALRTRHRALDEQQAALDVGLHDAQVLRRDPVVTHVTSHLLVLEGLAGILTLTGRTDRAVRQRHTVGGAQTA